MNSSALTDKILAYKYLSDFTMDEAVDWAVEMLVKGYETPSLLILSGISKPAYIFEVETYLLNSLSELNIEFPERHKAILNYCKHFIKDIADSKNVKANLYQLYKVANTNDDDKSIFDFYLLYWAWSDLDYGNTYQHYWPEAIKENIESIVINVAQKWLTNQSTFV